ncbi:MAG TPA: YdcF family protein [Thermomicrobiales bacterium]|nr:YdcF family protein [Thermomicrobiales bacterium]
MIRSLQDIGDFVFVSDVIELADAIVIPGGSFPETAEHAASLFRKGLAPIVIPSGSHSFKLEKFPGPKSKSDIYHRDYSCESAFLRHVLEINGVPSSAIVEEPLAVHTMDNAWKTAKLIQDQGLDIRSAIIVSKPFHARRCLLCYELAMPEVRFMCSPFHDPVLNRDNWLSTAQGRKRILGELQKCGEQFFGTISDLLERRAYDEDTST